MKTFLAASFGTVAVKLLAQAVPLPVDAGLVGLIGNAGVIGILIWYLWYHTTTSYPRMLKTFADEVREIRTTFIADQKDAREVFMTDQAELRKTFLLEQSAAREYARSENVELRGMLVQALASMRVAVHDVRDTANAVTQSNAIAKAEREKQP